MPFTIEEATGPKTFTLEEAIGAKTFTLEEAVETPDSRVAKMADATRHTVGVVGRAVAARDFAVAGYDAPNRSQLEDGYQPDEAAMTDQTVAPVATLRRAIQPLEASSLLAPMFGRFPRVTAQEVSDALSMLASGSPDLTQEESEAVIEHTTAPGNLEKIVAGAQRAAINIPEAATTPLGVATLGAGALPAAAGRVVSGAFAVDMARHIPEQVGELRAAIASKDSGRITEASGNLFATGLMTAAAAKHAAFPKPIEKLTEVAPLTADAVAATGHAPLETVPATITPLTSAAVESVKAKEPVTEPPAPTPAAATSELGTTPVTAVEPPAKPSVTPDVTLAKPEGEQALTRVPEHLRPSKAVQDILNEQPAVQPPQGGLKTAVVPAPEGGAVFGIGGRRAAPVATVGVTPRQDPNWLRIPAAIKRVGKGLFTEGTRQVLGRVKNQVGQALAKATRQHVDVEQELFGQHESILRKADTAIPDKLEDAAWTDASQYVRETQNGRPAPAVSPEAQSVLDAWFEVGKSTGDIARANNVQVFDPTLGGYRPMGIVEDYVPRMFRTEVEGALRDPQSNPTLFNDLAQAIATKKGIPLDEAAAELRSVAGRFQANDYMANLEMARSEQMPEIFYDYNLRNLAARYLPAYSERMAQIIAYGQRLGTREAPVKKNLWDIARREAEDADTQAWLNAAEDQATGFKPKNALERNARRLQAISSASLLSDPTTTVVRNTLSGVAATTEAYGVGRSVRQLREAMTTSTRLSAREAGVIRDDLAAFLNSDQLGDSKLDNAIRKVSEFALSKSGFTGSENFVRTHNAAVASSFARDAAASLASKPTSKLSKEALAQFKRWDIDPELIVKEGGDWRTGPETRKYVRTAVREMQGGYRFDQVPLWANSTAGRFFYQYGRWGVQRAQNIFQNIIKPAIGEEVTFRGKKMRYHDLLPLIRAAALTVGLGETFGAISLGLFDKDRRDSSLSEIGEAWTEDELKAARMVGERIANDIIMAGTLGIIGQVPDFAKSAKDQSRFKNPLDPPSAAGIKTLAKLAQRAVDQDGTLTKRDWLDAAAGLVRGPKNVADVARNITWEPLYEGQNDQRTLRNAAVRWAKETGQDVPNRAGMEIRKSPTSPAYEAINDALLAGDSETAKKAADEWIAKQPDKEKARAAVKSSVNARHPFRAGNLTSEANRNAFMEWAKKKLSPADLNQVERIQKRYEDAASAAGLL